MLPLDWPRTPQRPELNSCMIDALPLIEPQMPTHRAYSDQSSGNFAGETLRALRSALLLLGLSGDRRAR